MKRRIQRAWAVALIGMTVVAAGCGGDEADPPADAPAGATLIDLQNFSAGDPDHIDPALAGVLQGIQIGTLLYDGLTEFDFADREDPALVGQVAEAWRTADEGLTWEFTLRPDQVFSDGSPVLPSSFARGWERATDPDMASPIAYLFSPIAGVAAHAAGDADAISGVRADDKAMTLTIELTERFAEFPAVVSHPAFSPMPAQVDRSSDPTDWENGVMIGNGPFAMAGRWQHNRVISLERNERWAGGIDGPGARPALARIDFRISKDLDSAFTDFTAGNGDTAYIPPGRFREAIADFDNATEPTLGLFHFFVNQESQLGGAENLPVRQAIGLAIDRQTIIDTIDEGSRAPATGVTPPGVPGYRPGLCETCEYDPDRARELIGQWRAGGGRLDDPIAINYPSGAGQDELVALMQDGLKAVGLEAQLAATEPTTYGDRMRGGGCELCAAGWSWDYPVYDNAIYALLASASIDGDNLARFDSPTLDEAITLARRTLDPSIRGDLYRAAEKEALDAGAIIPINWSAGRVAYGSTIEGLVQTPLQLVEYQNVTKADEES